MPSRRREREGERRREREGERDNAYAPCYVSVEMGGSRGGDERRGGQKMRWKVSVQIFENVYREKERQIVYGGNFISRFLH